MTLRAFETHPYRLPLAAPLRLGAGTYAERAGVLVRLEDADGREAWGDCAPLPGFSRESLDEATADLDEARARLLRRQDDLGGLCPSARFAVEAALSELRANGRDWPSSICAGAADTVPLNGLLTGDAEAVLADASRLARDGYRAAKLKVGRRPVAEDAELVRRVRGALGGRVALRLDANRAWALDEALDFARAVMDCEIEYIEEPLRDPSGLPGFARQTTLPVALDETVVGLGPHELSDHAYARAFVLKPMLLGWQRALDLAEAARAMRRHVVPSGAFESGVGVRAMVAFAAAVAPGVPAGLDPYRWLADDVLTPRLPLPAPSVSVREALAPPTVSVPSSRAA